MADIYNKLRNGEGLCVTGDMGDFRAVFLTVFG